MPFSKNIELINSINLTEKYRFHRITLKSIRIRQHNLQTSRNLHIKMNQLADKKKICSTNLIQEKKKF